MVPTFRHFQQRHTVINEEETFKDGPKLSDDNPRTEVARQVRPTVCYARHKAYRTVYCRTFHLLSPS